MSERVIGFLCEECNDKTHGVEPDWPFGQMEAMLITRRCWENMEFLQRVEIAGKLTKLAEMLSDLIVKEMKEDPEKVKLLVRDMSGEEEVWPESI